MIIIVFFILLTFLAKWTTFGRHVYAVGGNAEAARRAGISVPRIRVLVFMISGATAGIGGIIFAAQVNSVALTFPPGNLLLNAIASAVIGGVSLFGGRGEVRGALLGAVLIGTLQNGLNTLNVSNGWIYIITGLVLLGAVVARHVRAPAAGPLRSLTNNGYSPAAHGVSGEGSSRSSGGGGLRQGLLGLPQRGALELAGHECEARQRSGSASRSGRRSTRSTAGSGTRRR